MTDINAKISSLRKDWSRLATKLTLLTLAELTDEHFSLIAQMHAFPEDKKIRRAFRDSMPITVARFKESAAQEIYEWANRQARSFQRYYPKQNNLLREIPLRYGYDTKRINHVLFGSQTGFTSFQIGWFHRVRTGDLHSDSNHKQASIVYVTRLFNLPLRCVEQKRLATASKGERMLINVSRQEGLRSNFAQAALLNSGLLKESALGDVVMLAAGKLGTLHSSSPVPPGGLPSAFFRTHSSMGKCCDAPDWS